MEHQYENANCRSVENIYSRADINYVFEVARTIHFPFLENQYQSHYHIQMSTKKRSTLIEVSCKLVSTNWENK